MKRVTLLLTVATCMLLASCQGSERATGPKGPNRLGNKPLSDLEAIDCQLDEAKCNIIRAGIEYLLNHANEMCRQAGNRALERFQAPPGSGQGFRAAPQEPTLDMGVIMQPGISASGEVASDGYIDVYPSFWNSNTDPNYAGSLIAHEEQHQNGMDNRKHTTGYAMMWQNACMNPQA